MRVVKNVLGLMGQTPLVELSSRVNPTRVRILVKLEYYNPAGSIKDRMALWMVEAAERAGKLKPGMTIVEPSSGNTGRGLALVALLKGYKLVVTVPDKVSQEKIDLLKAYGAEVIVCPTAVDPHGPESYHSVAARVAKERGAFRPDQYNNMANPEAHYRTTGPEIWEQTEGKLDAFVAGVGTGGTISGTARYLKEQNPKVKVIGVDPEGSMIYSQFYKKQHDIHTYVVEGIGEDFIPKALDLSLIDEVIRVSDGESFKTARDLLRKEGLFVGGSSGSAVLGALRYAEKMKRGTMVVLLPDSGYNYLGKIYSDEWMREKGYL